MTKREAVRKTLLNLRKLGFRRFDLLGLTRMVREDYGFGITDGSVSRYLRFENADPFSPVQSECISRRKSWYRFVDP